MQLLPSFCPPALKRYKELQKLQKKIEETRSQINKTSSEITKCKQMFREENIQKISIQQKLKEKTLKIATLETKNYSNAKKLSKEKEIQSEIYSKPTFSSISSKFDVKILIEEILNEFTTNSKKDVSYKKKLQTIPTCNAWSKLIKMLDLEKGNVDSLLEDPKANKNDENLSYDLSLARANTEHILLMLDIKKITHLRDECNLTYNLEFEPFYDTYLSKFKSFHGENQNEELFDEFVATHLKKSILEGGINYLRQEIENMKLQMDHNQMQIDENEPTIQSFNDFYDDIAQSFEQIQVNLNNMRLVKSKFIYYSNAIVNAVDNLKMARANNNLNAAVESFCLNESVFCSTKIGNLDNTMDGTLK